MRLFLLLVDDNFDPAVSGIREDPDGSFDRRRTAGFLFFMEVPKMIHPSDIKEKDFSIVLPGLSLKLGAISSALIITEDYNYTDYYSPENLTGFGLIIRDIMDDLVTIEKALYPDRDLAGINQVS